VKVRSFDGTLIPLSIVYIAVYWDDLAVENIREIN